MLNPTGSAIRYDISEMFTVKQIKLMNELIASGISKKDLNELYDALKPDALSRSIPSPPNSQPLPDPVNSENESLPSSQNDSMSLVICPDYDGSNHTNFQSTNHADEDPGQNQSERRDQNSTFNSEKKRDRFVFKQCHHDILNEAFLQNPYPEIDEKEILVDKCNNALRQYKNRPLKETEIMTLLNISNWFNNRRKEKRRSWNLESTSLSTKYRKKDNRVKEEIIYDLEDI